VEETMTTTTQATPKTLNANELTTLAKAQGPCVTIRVPDFHPGAGGPTRSVLLRQLTQNAATQLRDMHKSQEAEKVITSLEQLASISEAAHGGPGFTLFVSPDTTEVFRTPGVHEHTAVGECFDLLAHVAPASAPPVIYALGVSKKQIRFWKIDEDAAEELPLPPGVPESLAEAAALDQPDHNLESRASAGPSAGGIHGVRFGTSTDRDTDADYLHNFLTQVHRGVKAAVKGVPVFLVGVKEELAEYRKAAKGNGVLEMEWHNTPERCAADQLAARAREAAQARYRMAAESTLKGLPETTHHLTGNLEAITQAAKDGRVHKLVVAENAVAGAALNQAVVEALRTGAEVAALPVADLPQIGIAGAILRY
jgi:hypothetical protein